MMNKQTKKILNQNDLYSDYKQFENDYNNLIKFDMDHGQWNSGSDSFHAKTKDGIFF